MRQRFIVLVAMILVVFAVQSISISTSMASPERMRALEASVLELIAQQPGSWRVFIKDLKSKEEIIINSRPGESAGIIKFWVAAEAYRQEKNGMISLQEKVVIDAGNKSGGTGTLKKLPNGTSVTYKQVLDAMLTAGDVTALNLMIEKLGWENLNNTIKNMGCEDTSIGRLFFPPATKPNPKDGYPPGHRNRTSVRDLGLVLEKLYNGQVVGSKADSEILNASRKNARVRLAKMLPVDIPMSRQAGLLLNPRLAHDAGIIYGKHTDIIVAVMTHNVKDSAPVMAQLGKLAYEYLDRS